MENEELSLQTSQMLKRLRLRANLTQRDVADATGLAVSYISRLENHKVVPTITTLGRIASALDVSIEALFQKAKPKEHKHGKECPVTISGSCIMSQLSGSRAPRKAEDEQFTKRRIEVLRKCNYLLHRGDEAAIAAFTTLLDALLPR